MTNLNDIFKENILILEKFQFNEKENVNYILKRKNYLAKEKSQKLIDPTVVLRIHSASRDNFKVNKNSEN